MELQIKRPLLGAFLLFVISRFIGQFEYPALGIPPLQFLWDLAIIFGLGIVLLLRTGLTRASIRIRDCLLVLPVAAYILHFCIFSNYAFSSDSLFKGLISSAIIVSVLIARTAINIHWPPLLKGWIVFFILFSGELSLGSLNFLIEQPGKWFNYAGIGQRNIYASILSALLLLLAHLENNSSRGSSLVRFICLSLGALIVFATASRVGSLGLIIGALILFLAYLTRRQANLIATNLGAISIGISTYFLLEYSFGGDFQVLRKALAIGSDSSTFFRLVALSLIPEVLAANPLIGFGPNSSHLTVQLSFIEQGISGPVFSFTHPHNLTADVIIEFGMLGFTLFCLPYILWLLSALNVSTILFRLGISFPLLLHTQTELPLEQSGFFILMLAFATTLSDKTTTQLSTFSNNKYFTSLSVFTCFICLVIAIELAITRHNVLNKFQTSALSVGSERAEALRSDYLATHWYYDDFYRNRMLLIAIDQQLTSQQPRKACNYTNEISRFTLAVPNAVNYQATTALAALCNDSLTNQLALKFSQLNALLR